MKKEKGMSLIVLILLIVLVGIIIITGMQYLKKYAENQEKADIKATMLSIQGIITNVKNKNKVDEENNLLEGTKIEIEDNQTQYQINDDLKNILLELEEPELYVLNFEELQTHGINNIKITETEFYIIDYKTNEVYYSLGIDGKYKLSEM